MNCVLISRLMQSKPRFKKSYYLDIKTEFDDPTKLLWKLRNSATTIESKSKKSGKYGSRHSQAEKLGVELSLVESQEELADMDVDVVEDGMDIDEGDRIRSFQDTLADKSNRVCLLCYF